MKKLLVVCLGCAMWGILGCSDYADSSDAKIQKQTEEAMKEANAQIGMPAIKNFQERKLAKMIFELRDQENLMCYAYLVNLEGKLVFIGKCLGFGLPYSIQYTNPEKVIRYHKNVTQYGTLPQPDPNGLFMPSGLSATWLMMLDKDGKPHPVYCEPQIIVSPFPLTD